jgi:short-subunit dehydrogenase
MSAFREKYGPWGVVAGASEGLGAAFASELAGRGIHLVLLARRAQALEEVAAGLRAKHGVEVRTAAVDLGEGDVVERVKAATDGLDVGLLVYNAAFSEVGPFLDQSVAGKLKTLDVNCRAPLLLADHFGRTMTARGRGGILLMSSLAGFQGTALVSVYAATKAFNIVLGEGLWEELRGKGVDVLPFIAGATTTPNFLKTEPRKGGLLDPPLMSADAVAREALDALGHGPRAVAGGANRFALFMMERFLGRRQRVKVMGRAMRKLYAREGGTG